MVSLEKVLGGYCLQVLDLFRYLTKFSRREATMKTEILLWC